jgi:hypothetical protein
MLLAEQGVQEAIMIQIREIMELIKALSSLNFEKKRELKQLRKA